MADSTRTTTAIVGATWADVLGCTDVDPNVGFFDMGAVSVDVVRAVERLRGRWPRLRVVDVFLYPTVNELARFLDS